MKWGTSDFKIGGEDLIFKKCHWHKCSGNIYDNGNVSKGPKVVAS